MCVYVYKFIKCIKTEQVGNRSQVCKAADVIRFGLFLH